jgi:hypothetical protein
VNWRSLCVKNSQKQAAGLLVNLGDRRVGKSHHARGTNPHLPSSPHRTLTTGRKRSWSLSAAGGKRLPAKAKIALTFGRSYQP